MRTCSVRVGRLLMWRATWMRDKPTRRFRLTSLNAGPLFTLSPAKPSIEGHRTMFDEIPSNVINILLVEDNPGDVRLTEEALKDAKLLHCLHVAEDGEAALDFLFQRERYSRVPRPNLVLLDLNLPKLDGRRVLETMKSNDTLKAIPVVILTGSQSDIDIARAHNLKASCYVTKPVDFIRLAEIVRTTQDSWTSAVAKAS